MTVCLQNDNQAHFYIEHINILFIDIVLFVSFIMCNFESKICIIPIYVVNINDRWMIYFMWIILFSRCLLSNVDVG